MELKQLKTHLNNNIEIILDKLDIKYEVFGTNFYSTCPIHNGSDNPRAFSFCKKRSVWRCWTQECQHQYKNDVFGLIIGVLSSRCGKVLEFKDAIKWIDKTLNCKNIDYHINTNQDNNDDDYFLNLIETFKHKTISPKEEEIDLIFNNCDDSQYFKDRGFKLKTLNYFGVSDCVEHGVMKDRSIIPIHNDDGSKIIGVIGRSIKEYKIPKFLIYPKGFDKRFYLYNYHRAINRAVETSSLFIVEGQGDVWKLFEAGVSNAVSLFGKNISEEQVYKINKLPVTKLIIIMDNDQAGKEARIQAHRQLSRMYKLIFPRITAKDLGEMSVKQIKDQVLINLEGMF